ncbi:tail tape measure protein [Lactococcus phage AM7]|uniref:Tail tape measure protein n=2 Tax=Teubervirus AM6 TaxID=2845190 RepID=A0A1W6JIH2_9CAUD|nr:tail length tape measure protein [Lactococcus phage AM6]ARM66022.1 tail tape measure protein [Lactococcus phage AM6]ARM66112.1 tail tape measure protein [Lactococcus phage AM7]
MGAYSEQYNLRLEAVGTKEVLAELKAIDQMAERLEKDGLDIRVNVNGLAQAQSQVRSLSAQAEQLERDGIDLKINVNGYAQAMGEINGITAAQARAIRANQNEAKTQVGVERQKIGVLNDQFRLYNNLQKSSSGLTDKIQASLRGMNQFSNSVASAASTVQRMSGMLAIGTGVGIGAIGVGIAGQVKGAFQYAQEVDKARQQLKAQGVEGKKLENVYQDIVKYANVSPFDVGNMTQAVSQMNSFTGDIDKSMRATKAFSESIFASGGDISALGNVAYNLGQISTNQFSKVDYKELVKNVPAMSQALRQYKGDITLVDKATGKLVKKSTEGLNLSNWEDFNKLLGDDPTTQAIERQYDAFSLVTDAMEKYNQQTHALETANKALPNKLENLAGAYKTVRHEALESSGAYDAFGKVIDTLSEKLQKDPAVKGALKDLFSGITPLIQKAEQGIKNFDITAFVNGLKEGGRMIADNFKAIINNPIIQGFGKMLGKAIGAEGNVGDIGRGLGKLFNLGVNGFLSSTAIKIAFTGLSKGSALVNAGIHASKALGNMLGKAKIPASFATEAGELLGTNVGQQFKTPAFSSAFSGKLGAFLKGGLQIGGGVAAAGIGIGVGAWAGAQGMKAIVEVAKKLTDTVNYVADNLPNANSDKAYQMVAKLHLLDKMAAIVSNAGLGGGMKSTISSAITNVAAIASGFGMATGNLTLAGVGLMVQGVRLLGAYIDQISAQTEGIKIENVAKLAALPKKFDAIPADFDPNTIADKIKKIQDTVSKVHEALGIKVADNGYVAMSSVGEMLAQIDQAIPANTTARVTKTFTNLKTLAQTFQSFGDIKETGSQVVTGLNNLRSTIAQVVNSGIFTDTLGTKTINLPSAGGGLIGPNQVQADTTMGNQLGQLEAQLSTVTGKIKSMLPKIKLLSDLSAQLTAIPPINPGAITQKMTDINTTVTSITKIWSGAESIAGDGKSGGGSIGTVDFSAILEVIRGGIKVGKEVATLGTMNIPNATGQINNMKASIEALGGLNGGAGLGGLNDMLSQAGAKITEFAGKANGEGITSSNNLKNALNQLGSASTSNGGKLTDLGGKANDAGSKFDSAKGKADSLKSAIDNVGSAASGAGGKISSLASQMNAIVSAAGNAKGALDSLKGAIDSLPSSKSIKITVNDEASSSISSIQSKLNGIQSKSVDVTTNYKETGKKGKSATGGVMMARGGYVSQMFKNASRTFGAGQDTINAVLARGEAVIRRSSTAILGKTFVDHVNNGRMQQAYETMGNRMSSMYNNRYDNRSFNNQANITQNFYGGSTDGNNYLKSYIKGV